jgi:hypothetical protein
MRRAASIPKHGIEAAEGQIHRVGFFGLAAKAHFAGHERLKRNKFVSNAHGV